MQAENHALYVILLEQCYSKKIFSPPLFPFCIFRPFSLVPDHQFAKSFLQFSSHKVYNKEISEKEAAVCSNLLLPF